MNIYAIIGILTAIGIACGVLIYVANRVLPSEPESLKKAEEVSENLPGMNCGACGYPGCFAYAQALSEDKDVFFQKHMRHCPPGTGDAERPGRPPWNRSRYLRDG